MTLVGLDAWALWGFSPHQQSLDINFPLSRGLYYVWNGGSSALINQCPFRDKQQHAVDIVKLNLIGVRSSDVPARGLGSYEIFGDVVQSPCDGIVVQVRQGSADSQNPVPGLEFHTGNLVAVECAGVNLYFLHLMDSSIVVEKGELVVTGQYLGVVGNSGDSEEPHLHVHAERGGVRGEIFTGESVPLHFNGRYLVRNSLVCKDCF